MACESEREALQACESQVCPYFNGCPGGHDLTTLRSDYLSSDGAENLMSVHISGPAWHTSFSNPIDKLVLLSIADQANDEGRCWPGSTTEAALSERTGYGRAAVMRARANLESYGVLVVVSKVHGKSTEYRINVEALGKAFHYIAPESKRTEKRAKKQTGSAKERVRQIDGSEPDGVRQVDGFGKQTGSAEELVGVRQEDGDGFGKETGRVRQKDGSYIKELPSINEEERKVSETGAGAPARPPDPPEMLFELLRRVPAVANCPPQTRDAQIATLGDRMRLIEVKHGEIDWEDAGVWIVDQCLGDSRWAGNLTVSPGEMLSKMQSALERFFLREKAAAEDPEDAAVKADHPELWSAVEILFTAWRGRGIGFNRGILMREYVRTLHRFGVTSALVFRFADAAGNDIKWALPAHDLATFILTRCKEKQVVVVMDDGAADELRQRAIEEFGKADVPMAELRAAYRKRFGLDGESAA